MSTQFTTWAMKTADTNSTARTLPSRLNDIINVKDYGATGDGATDDTQSIQAALNAAFGSGKAGTANGYAGRFSNKEVYFPPGNYKVSCPQNRNTITNVTCDNSIAVGTGHLTYTTGAAHGFTANDLVFVYVPYLTLDNQSIVNGDSNPIVAGDVSGVRFIASVTPTTFTTAEIHTLNFWNGLGAGRTWTTSLSPGAAELTSFVCTPALRVDGVYGGLIRGGGSHQSVQITLSPASDGMIFLTNGWKGSHIDSLMFAGGNGDKTTCFGGCIFDVDRDNYSSAPSYQGLSFDGAYNCWFDSCYWGSTFGQTNLSQADTCTYHDCTFNNCTVGLDVGLFTNFNAININVVGGNFMGNTYGIHTLFGTYGLLAGICFEVSTGWDIFIAGGTNTTHISGVSTESPNFLYAQTLAQIAVDGVNQRSGSAGYFFGSFPTTNNVAAPCIFNNCMSIVGGVFGGGVTIFRNCTFGNASPFVASNGYMRPFYVENCSIGGGYNINNNDKYFEPTHICGFFLNDDSSGQWFLGKRKSQTGYSSGTYTGTAIPLYRVADLPPIANFNTVMTSSENKNSGYIAGQTVTVFDSSLSYVSSNRGVVLSSGGSGGGGSNIVQVFNNGTDWVIA